MSDLIDRQSAVDEIHKYFLSEMDKEETKTEDGWEVYADMHHVAELLTHNKQICTRIKALPSAQRWISVKTRPMDEEERTYYKEVFDWQLDDEDAVMFDCPMPEDGQEVWVCSKCGNVWQDTCFVDEGIGLEENGDWLDIVAWMPFERPEPWKGDSDATD